MNDQAEFLFDDLDAQRRINPMIRAYGTGPPSTTCSTCQYFDVVHDSPVCSLRRPDETHLANWQSCRKYIPEE